MIAGMDEITKIMKKNSELAIKEKMDSYSYDNYKKMDNKEKFAFEVVCRDHKCNRFLHLISCLRLQKLYEEKKFQLCEEGGSSIGIAFVMICKTCAKRYDITDYERW